MTNPLQKLSRRERQIMDAIYALGEASAQDVLANIPEPPSYSAVRAMLAKLVNKDAIAFKQDGAKYIYYPKVAVGGARKSAIQRLVTTFFAGSVTDAILGLVKANEKNLSADDIERLEKMVANAKLEQKNKQ